MRAMLIDYIPSKHPMQLSLDELNAAIDAIRRDGGLRMHAMGRLLDELEEIASRLNYAPIADEQGFLKSFEAISTDRHD